MKPSAEHESWRLGQFYDVEYLARNINPGGSDGITGLLEIITEKHAPHNLSRWIMQETSERIQARLYQKKKESWIEVWRLYRLKAEIQARLAQNKRRKLDVEKYMDWRQNEENRSKLRWNGIRRDNSS
jgi:hypothetical protein